MLAEVYLRRTRYSNMTKKEKQFVKTVKEYYRRHGRLSLPWRLLPADRQGQRNPYRILVSEIMLQQTQVDRVILKYRSFIKKFPTVKTLADATLAEVLKEWQGLGYNRRAKMLHDTARMIVSAYSGRFPKTREMLQALPGVGQYTSGAIMAFAYNEAVPIIETNIRTAYLHHFFGVRKNVRDVDIYRYIDRTIDRKNPRTWYAALMDYGSYLKQALGNQNRRSRHYTKQTRFKGSDREVRGAIVRMLTNGPCTFVMLEKGIFLEYERLVGILEKLVGEGLVMRRHRIYSLPE